jgi:putative aldouronate transport system substrate-binding protein
MASSLSSSFETTYPFYVDGKTVKFGPLEQNYRDFVAEMHKWYAEGLLDRDMPSINKATVAAKFSNGNAGVVVQQRLESLNAIIANENTPEYNIVAAKSLVKKAGDIPQIGHLRNAYDGGFAYSISTQCKDIETAIRYADYFWSEEGQIFCSYGTEGVSYEVRNGEYMVLESLLAHPEIPSAYQALQLFGYPTNFPFRMTVTMVGEPEEIKDMVRIWSDNNMENHVYPVVSHTPEELEIEASKFNDIDLYCKEMIVKFIIGTEPLANYDRFIQTLKSYGIGEVLKAKQTAYDRYMER